MKTANNPILRDYMNNWEDKLNEIALQDWLEQEECDIEEGAREFFLYEIEDLSWSTKDRKKLDNYTPIP